MSSTVPIHDGRSSCQGRVLSFFSGCSMTTEILHSAQSCHGPEEERVLYIWGRVGCMRCQLAVVSTKPTT